jgi:transposase
VRNARVWRALLGVEKAVIERVGFDEQCQALVAQVRPVRAAGGRCGVCRRRCGRYDAGQGRRRWRALDVGTVQALLEADAPRVSCPRHGVVVADVPWARHGAGHTIVFDEQVAWLATQCSKTAVTELMRIAWRTVGSIIARVWADVDALGDRLEGLTRIGIDEISYKRHHRYLTVVVDHDTGRLLWAAPGRDRATLRTFFDQLGPDRCALITHVSADQADWIAEVVAERCPDAVQCADPFHIVKWATEALDEVRRQAWNEARRSGQTRGKGYGNRVATGDARRLKYARYALWKNPDNLTDRQREKPPGLTSRSAYSSLMPTTSAAWPRPLSTRGCSGCVEYQQSTSVYCSATWGAFSTTVNSAVNAPPVGVWQMAIRSPTRTACA